MKAMILAAGEGRRMRPLTLSTPKPLLPVAGKALIQWHIERLRAAGITQLVINVAYLGDQIIEALGDGSALGVSIEWSREPQPLETGGALLRALPLLGGAPFILVNADVWTDYRFESLRSSLVAPAGAHLVLTPNPPFNPNGDFTLDEQGRVAAIKRGPYTFAGVSKIDPQLIATYPDARETFPLLEALRYAHDKGCLSGEVHRGQWSDIGTPQRLEQLRARVETP